MLPLRSSWITSAPLRAARTSSVIPPGVRRNWSETSPSPWMPVLTCGEPVSRLARAIQPNLRCGLTPAPNQAPGRHDEIPAHAPPHEVEVVVVAPDIAAGAGDGIDLPPGIVLTGTRQPGRSDLRLGCKLTEWAFLEDGRHDFVSPQLMLNNKSLNARLQPLLRPGISFGAARGR